MLLCFSLHVLLSTLVHYIISPGFLSHHSHSLVTPGGVKTHPVTMATADREAPLVQAEMVVQVLVEFWLNQNMYNGRQGDILAQAQVHVRVDVCV